MSDSVPGTTNNSTSTRTAVLALVLAGIGVLIAYLEYQGNALETARKRPSVLLHVASYDVPKHTEAVDVEALFRELSGLEERHSRYSGAYILAAEFHLRELDTALTREKIVEELVAIREGISSLEDRRSSLAGELSRVLEDWKGRSGTTQDQVVQLETVERDYFAFTGSHIIDLIDDVQMALTAPRGERDPLKETIDLLESASREIEEQAPFDEDGYQELREELQELQSAYSEGKEIHRLRVEVVVENQSQLPTVIRREARIEFRDPKHNVRTIDVRADEPLNLGPYSVGRTVLVASTLDTLEDLDVDFVNSNQEEVDCTVAVVDLRYQSWSADCGQKRPGEVSEILQQELAAP